MNILLAAEESAGLRVLQALSKTPHRIVAVLAGEDTRGSVGSSVWSLAKSLGYETWPAALVRTPELAERLRDKNVDLLLNVHSLYIIHEDVLAVPVIGSFNLHPGPLPQYAGLNAPSWAIYNGETSHAVTLHKMAPGIDTGPVVFERRFPISDADTGLTVALRCIQEGVPLVLELLEIASRRPAEIPLRPQALERRKYYGKKPPHGGRIEWNRSARQVFDFIRACDYAPFPSPWGRPQTVGRGREVAVTKAVLTGEKCGGAAPGTIRHDGGRFSVACSDEWLEIRKMLVEGKGVPLPECLTDAERFEPG
ncbi:MAG: hypothetical protein HYS13_11745 [Planctomycetia bacterium]|nr:hypothetical protein [Planctomycetia bacterium]